MDLKGRTFLKLALILTFSPGEKEQREHIFGLWIRLLNRLSQPQFSGIEVIMFLIKKTGLRNALSRIVFSPLILTFSPLRGEGTG
ncbi:MAG TPA: hypothetical protein VGN23_11730 [Verrucomicrobiae bacterium]